ncbi:DUF6875 domain-containing protein [Cytobacillus kochii]|uniref:DUF6875 domain-containing protein n=1 Tax=Cytobacillus kochii TaxID=859143 RepID=UPI002040C7EB|nr:hypothetical protein [Cytobacillus kochii]MCM3324763.1 hypothetical protein [Cytobacillus kochii]MCM3347156.1 hypothetical protein [Cytobacillus kochii]
MSLDIGNTSFTEFDSYLDNMTKSCPFLKPALDYNSVINKRFQLNDKNYKKIEENIFWISLQATEEFRNVRRALTGQKKTLFNVNLIFIYDEGIKGNVLDWPHYILKLLYSKVGVVYGKFHNGALKTNRHGLLMPSPPFTHLAIRSAIKSKDARFFNKTPDLVDDILTSKDEREDVLAPFGVSISDINPFSNKIRNELYQELYNWAKESL